MFHHLHNGEGTNEIKSFPFFLSPRRPHASALPRVQIFLRWDLFFSVLAGRILHRAYTVDTADLRNEYLSIKAPPGDFFFFILQWEEREARNRKKKKHSEQPEKICSLNVLKWPFCPLENADRRLPLIESGMMRIYVTVNLLRNQSERFFPPPQPSPFPSPTVEDIKVAEFNAIKKKKKTSYMS